MSSWMTRVGPDSNTTCPVGGKQRGQMDGGGGRGTSGWRRVRQRPPELHAKSGMDSSRIVRGNVAANSFIRISST